MQYSDQCAAECRPQIYIYISSELDFWGGIIICDYLSGILCFSGWFVIVCFGEWVPSVGIRLLAVGECRRVSQPHSQG